MTDFLTFCRLHGILIDTLPPMGVWRRYKTEDKPQHRNGAVKFMGDFGVCQNHATMTDVALWRPDNATPLMSPRDEAAMRDQRRREADRRTRAIRSAREFWNDSKPLNRPHPYIERKGLSPLGCAGLRTNGDLLVVPVLVGDALMSVQTISPDGEKRFWTGAPVKGGVFVLRRDRSAVTAFVEGLATGLAIFQAVRKASVVVAFDCGNLLPAAERVKPSGAVVICADNDHRTEATRGVNPGLEKARNVAELLGCGVAYPEGIEGSDFADALKEWGTGAAKRIERAVLANTGFVMT